MKLALGNSLATQRIGGAAPAWTPADIADLALFFHFKPGANCAYASNGGAAAGAGDPVGYAAPLFGTSISASEATNKPTLQADGLQLDAAGVELLNFSSQFSATDITVYWSMIVDAGSSVACFASDTVQPSLLGGASDVSIYDNTGNPQNSALFTTNAVVMGRLSMDAGGNYSMISTGGVATTGTVPNNNGFDFNQIGGTGAIGGGNDSTANRFRLVIAINRAITLDSAEDLLIRNWISTNDGAEL